MEFHIYIDITFKQSGDPGSHLDNILQVHEVSRDGKTSGFRVERREFCKLRG